MLRKIDVTLGLIASAVLVVPIAVYYFYRRGNENNWNAAVSAARAKGVPTSFREAIGSPDAPPIDENAAIVVQSVAQNLYEPEGITMRSHLRNHFQSIRDEATTYLTPRFGQLPNVQVIKANLTPFKAELDRLEVGLRRLKWYVQQESLDITRPNVYHHELSLLLRARAIVAAASANLDGVRQHLGSLDRYAKHLGSQPGTAGLGGRLVPARQLRWACQDLIRMHPNLAGLDGVIRSFLEDKPPPPPLKEIWFAELARKLDLIDLYTTKQGQQRMRLNADHKLLDPEVATRIKVQLLEIMQSIDREWSDTGSLPEIAAKYEPQIHQTLEKADSTTSLETLKGVSFSTLPDIYLTEEASRRLAWLYVALAKQKPGQWQLPPDANSADWLDPFSGKPMILKTSPKGFALYSLGPNRADDGGTINPNGQSQDVVLMFP